MSFDPHLYSTLTMNTIPTSLVRIQSKTEGSLRQAHSCRKALNLNTAMVESSSLVTNLQPPQ